MIFLIVLTIIVGFDLTFQFTEATLHFRDAAL